MTTTTATLRHPSGTGSAATGLFMLTLCQFEGPVSIRPPQSPQLKRFTFFTTSARQREGAELVYLHMGYFETLADAQSLLTVVRRRFPNATANRAPGAVPQPNPYEPSFAPVADQSLTDTQVMKILETRGVTSARGEAEKADSDPIGVLRPEDTSTRRALKQAVAEGAPVFFAVQLDWSVRPINLDRVPTHPVFKTRTLYETQSRRDDRCRYFLRLGFFADAASAKEAAFSVRSKFASAVVVPVTEEEITRAQETSIGGLGFERAHLSLEQPFDHSPLPKAKSLISRSRRSSQRTETLEQTLESLAEQETWNDPDSLSDTGVRHLKVEVLERESGGS